MPPKRHRRFGMSYRSKQFPLQFLTVNMQLSIENIERMQEDTVITLRPDRTLAKAQQAAGAMELVRSFGHTECNSWCRPPFVHTGSAAAKTMDEYLAKKED